MKCKYSLLFIFLILLFISCNYVTKKITGIKNSKPASDEKIQKSAKKFNFPPNSCFKIDTALYNQNFLSLKGTNKKLLNDLLQPLQIRAYNKNHEMVFFLINCNVGGFPNLQWNRSGAFNTFPPDSKKFKSVDTTFTFKEDLKYYIALDNKPIDITLYENNDLNMIVYWAIFMGKQSKILINEMNIYKQKYSDKKINIMFINTDNLYEGK